MTHTLRTTGRILGAAALGATAGIHLHLWLEGYRSVPTIGPLFLLNAVGGSLLVLAVLAIPRRWLGLVALAGAGYEAATIAALLLASTRGLFGFYESSAAPLYSTSLAVESAGAVVLLATAALAGGVVRRPARAHQARSVRLDDRVTTK